MACAFHPEVAESYRCTSCEKRLCDACVRPVAHRVACAECGHEARAAAPIHDRGVLADVLDRVVSVEGITTSTAFAICYAMSYYLFVFDLIYVGTLVAYYFTVVHHVGGNHAGLPAPSDATVDWMDHIGSAVRGLACCAVAALPLIVYASVTKRLPSTHTTVFLLVLGQLVVPAAVLAVAFGNSTLDAVWPGAWIAVIARAPSAYVQFLGLWFIAVAIGIVVTIVLAPLGGPLGMFITASVMNLYWFGHAVTVGDFIRRNAAAFGWD
ncbi:MAG: hypothetical protein KIT31_31285 [Deltaproteobacteria bacterium]|nr:hypothetical protein [Deltaproteobacteria bacterium]